MKKILKLSMLIPCVFSATSSYSLMISVDRCKAGDTLPLAEALKVAKWARACPEQSLYTGEDDMDILDLGIKKMSRGVESYFPVWYRPGASEAWRAPFEDAEIRTRMENGDCSITIPTQYSEKMACQSGCFAFNQRLLFSNKKSLKLDIAELMWVPIHIATKEKMPYVVTLKKDATLEKLSFEGIDVSEYTSDKTPTKHRLFTIKTTSGSQIKVTGQHPLVDGNGNIQRASELKIGNSLLRLDGSKDLIVAIDQIDSVEKVYNLDTDSNELHHKIVVAEGFLTGTTYYQNSDLNKVNRSIFRSDIQVFL